ncbi:quinone oxidoreductase family protein [Caballeronia mineralivorans]|uniref:quinone oxidoreductase family protein n=1 Tax=Caballeronia mineralivorans TaxID=2010198 RepID=UPI0023F4009D|nr:quinone oxidoreductase [Caballeronia mineralivorans]
MIDALPFDAIEQRCEMKQILVGRTGGPEVLEIVSAPSPSPGRGEVLVDVEAAGINYVDVYQRNGAVDYQPVPFVPGYEGVGTVRQAGPGVASLAIGTRVAWINVLGSYAQQLVLPSDRAIRIPSTFTTDEGLLFQGVTAQYLLAEYHQIKPGDFVLVHAAAGGVGQFLVQWLKRLGAVLIGTASTEAKLQTIRSLGADHAVNYSDGNFLDAVFEITKGRGVDVAFDAVGATTFSSTVKALAPRGTAIAYGQASGVAPDVQIYPLILKGARVAGGSLFTYIQDPAEMQQRAAELICGIEEGWLSALPTTQFPLHDASSAHRAIESRSTQGKLALIP